MSDAKLEPTQADLEAADAFASHTDPISAGPIHIGFVSGILHERERAAGVAVTEADEIAESMEGQGEPDFTFLGGQSGILRVVAGKILRGPQP